MFFPSIIRIDNRFWAISFFKGAMMKKLALGVLIATFATGVFAAEDRPGGAAAGAGAAAGTETGISTNAILATAGVVAAGAVAAGSKAQSTTTHK